MFIVVAIVCTACDFNGDGNKITVNFVTNGGDEIEAEKFSSGSKIELPMDIFKGGYVLENWYLDSDLTKVVTPEELSKIKKGESVTVYAKWKLSIQFEFTTKDGVATIVRFQNDEVEELVIPDTLGGCTVKVIDDGAFSHSKNLKKISVPNTVTNIKDSAFYLCEKLENINIPSNLKTIGDEAFYGCSKLQNITLSSELTSIGSSAFRNCKSLTRINLPKNLATIKKDAFGNCNKLLFFYEGMDIPIGWENMNFSQNILNFGSTSFGITDDGLEFSVRNDKYAIIVRYSGSETEINIPQTIEGKDVLEIADGAFYKCKSIESVFIPQCVKGAGQSAFSDCDNLTIYWGNKNGYDDPFWNPTNRPVVWDCVSFGTTLDGFKYGITSSGNAVIGGYKGNTLALKLPSRIENKAVIGIAENAFRESAITNIDISNSVTKIEKNAFMNCTNLKNVTFAEDSQLNSIQKEAFYLCTSLENIVVPKGVQIIKDRAFYRCYGLKSVQIPTSVKTIERQAFFGCDKLIMYFEQTAAPLTDEYWDKDWKVVALDCMSNGMTEDGLCYGVSNSGKVKITMYRGDAKTLIIPSSIENKPTTEIIKNALQAQINLLSLTIPESIEKIEENAVRSMSIFCMDKTQKSEWADFKSYPVVWDCASSGVTDDGIIYGVKNNGEVVIGGVLDNVTSINIKSTIEGKPVTEIADFALRGLYNVTTVTFEENSNLKIIGLWALSGMRFKTIILPDGLTTIRGAVFDSCVQLESIFIPDSVIEIGKNVFHYAKSYRFLAMQLLVLNYGVINLVRKKRGIVSRLELRKMVLNMA